MERTRIANWNDLIENTPVHALVSNVDLVIIRWPGEERVSVLYGRCRHRGALMADGSVANGQLVCGLHGSTYRYQTGKNVHFPGADLKSFQAWIE